MSDGINKNGYNEWSSFYDEYPNPTVAIDDMLFSNSYSSVKNMNVFEIGCGTGRHTQRLVKNQNKVTAIDASSGMLEKARIKISDQSLKLIEGDFLETCIPNSPFDVVVMSLVLEHIKDLHTFFAKTRDLMNLNGTFFFSEIHPTRTARGITAHFKSMNDEEIHLSSFPHTEEDIRYEAERSGFSIEETKTECGNQALAERNINWKKYLEVPMIQIWTLRAVL